ncbi:MAG: lipoprotein [Burkholderiales bacterium]|nr:lipoprotein [Burkholderiales bacterium]MDE2398256.1 lipoprotein [Burkholderiales bacterium]MDE2452949.1 lipoprotein [Burkholderiales bacterium]
MAWALAGVLLGALLAGCGQKGPLVLPPPAAASAAAAS